MEYILIGEADNKAQLLTKFQFDKMNKRLEESDSLKPYIILGRFKGEEKIQNIIKYAKKQGYTIIA